MKERITHTTVTFRHPFELAGVDGAQPAGTYNVETTEEEIGGLSFLAYRRVSTTIIVASRHLGPASRQVVTIDPLDLAAAEKKDAAQAEPPDGDHSQVLRCDPQRLQRPSDTAGSEREAQNNGGGRRPG